MDFGGWEEVKRYEVSCWFISVYMYIIVVIFNCNGDEGCLLGVGGFEKGERVFCDVLIFCFGWIVCCEGCWCCNGGSMCCWEVLDSGMGSNGCF